MINFFVFPKLFISFLIFIASFSPAAVEYLFLNPLLISANLFDTLIRNQCCSICLQIALYLIHLTKQNVFMGVERDFLLCACILKGTEI